MSNVIDEAKFKQVCDDALQHALLPIAHEYRDVIATEFVYAHPTTKHWGLQLARHIQLLYDFGTFGKNKHYTIGFDDLQEYEAVRASVIEYGNGEIWTKPETQVYGADLKEKHRSTAQMQYRVPDLEHDGQHVLENSFIIANSKSKQWEDDASDNCIRYIAKHIKDCIKKT